MVDVARSRPFTDTLTGLRRSLHLVPGSFRLREERPADVGAREALLDAAFGTGRAAKTCERLREGRTAAAGLSFVATRGSALVGTLRLWHVELGDRASLMLGPLAVASDCRAAGVGRALMEHGLHRARKLGHESVILVGDAPYYSRFGFRPLDLGDFVMPGPVDEERFLGLDLVPGALAGARGRVVATGAMTGACLEGDYRQAA